VLNRDLSSFWSRFRKNRAANTGFYFIISMTLVAALAPMIAPYDPFEQYYGVGKQFRPPSLENLMGTDRFGRDVLSRIIWGARVSLFVGFFSTAICMMIGVPFGAVAGYYGGRVDEVLMRVVDIFLVLPTFFLILVIVAVFGSSIWNVMIVIGITTWPNTARLIRAEFLSLKEREFVQSAKTVGADDRHIMFREILPNAIYVAVVEGSLLIASSVLTEASLSFLGLGDPNHASWGWMLNDAMRSMRVAWWESAFPGLVLTLVVTAFNLIGDGLNDALNPYLKER